MDDGLATTPASEERYGFEAVPSQDHSFRGSIPSLRDGRSKSAILEIWKI